MKRLIYTCRNITGALLCNLKMLDGSTIDLLTSNKTDQCKIHIEDSVGININQRLNLYGDYYLNTAIYLKDWNEVYNSLDVSHSKYMMRSIYLVDYIFLNLILQDFPNVLIYFLLIKVN